MLRDVVEAQAPDPATVRYQFTGTQIRDLPSRLPVCQFCQRPTTRPTTSTQTTLDPPLGSGPYKLGDFKQGTFVSYRRRSDYWAKDLPVTRGRFQLR